MSYPGPLLGGILPLCREAVGVSYSPSRLGKRSFLKEQDLIQIEGLRLVLGAFKTFPVESLHAEAHEAPPQLKSKKNYLKIINKT